jgi:transcriptional regulator with XRE-family HTH domain
MGPIDKNHKVKTDQVQYRFGGKIRTVRERREMTMRTLAGKIGVSESLISQIERDRISPSLDTLMAIVDALEIDLEYLFKDYKRNKSVSVVKKNDRNRHLIDGVNYEQLSNIPSLQPEHAIEAFLLTLPPKAARGNSDYGHQGRELGFILAGAAELQYGTETYSIEEGDSISFSANIPHTLSNPGEEPLRALWIITPPRMFVSA